MTLPDYLGLDANIFIYEFDAAGPRTDLLHRDIFVAMRDGRRRSVASALAISEVLVLKLRAGEVAGADTMEGGLYAFPGLTLLPVSRTIARRAAEIRAQHNLRLVDAIHVATAAVAGAGAFLTNDRQLLRAASELPILILDDLVDAQ